jgi:hypothetical protein
MPTPTPAPSVRSSRPVSSLIINWRIWCWFLQVQPWGDWARNWRNGRANVTWTSLPGRPRKGEAPVALYQGRRYALLLVLLVLAILWVVA